MPYLRANAGIACRLAAEVSGIATVLELSASRMTDSRIANTMDDAKVTDSAHLAIRFETHTIIPPPANDAGC